MTELPMEGTTGPHLDEGTIHAWLDDALDAEAAERVAAHVRSCAACSERVAEARGLIAGASRIVGALDDVPAGMRSSWGRDATVSTGDAAAAAGQLTQVADTSLWRRLRVTPARAAIAAALVVAVGITLTHERGVLNGPEATVRTATSAPMAPSPTAAAPDHLLDSAVARNLAIARPERRVEAATSPAIPTPPAAAPALEAVDTQASTRVAIGREAIQAQRETTTAMAADRLRAGVAKALTRQDMSGAVAAAKRVEEESRGDQAAVASRQPAEHGGVSLVCYRVESSTPNARWAQQPLPLVVALDTNRYAGGRQARLFSASGTPLPMSASWSRTPADSLRVSLRRLGWTGTIATGPEAPIRAGVASSGLMARLEDVAVTGYGTTSADRSAKSVRGAVSSDRGARPDSVAVTSATSAAAPAAPSVPAAAAGGSAPAAAQSFAKRADRSVEGAQQVPVMLKPTACPSF